MRLLIGAGAALLFASIATAQTTPATPAPPALPSACGETTAAPSLPDPAHTNASQMTRANQAFEAWATDTRAKLQCRQGEVRAMAAQVAAAESTYNTQAASFTSTVNSWQSATASFNQQHAGNSGRQQHGGIVGNRGQVHTGQDAGNDGQ